MIKAAVKFIEVDKNGHETRIGRADFEPFGEIMALNMAREFVWSGALSTFDPEGAEGLMPAGRWDADNHSQYWWSDNPDLPGLGRQIRVSIWTYEAPDKE